VSNKEAKKMLTYNVTCKYITTEMQYMLNVKTEVIPIITKETGTISKSFRKYPRDLLGKHDSEGKWPYWALHTYFKKY
jgi:hypothetical protein